MNSAVAPRSAPNPSHGSRRLDAAALWYLALPNLIFLASWIKPLIGVPAAICLAALLWFASRSSLRHKSGIAPRLWLVAIVIALVWLFFSGVGHFVYANADWYVRDAVLHDLSTRSWPVQYSVQSDAIPVLLRAPLGYFLPAALIARMVDASLATPLLFVWTLIGVVITFLMMAGPHRRVTAFALLVFLFMFFSGMDLIGYIVLHDQPGIGQHIEWWAFIFQYSSITTQLLWVPNHALPGWIVAVWLLRHLDAGTFSIRWAVLLLAMTPLWSPLAAIGLGFLLLVVIAVRLVKGGYGASPEFRMRLREILDPCMLLGSLIVLCLIAPYLVMASGTVPGNMLLSDPKSITRLLELVAAFVMLEFGVFWLLMLKRYRLDLLLTASGVLLLLLPWYRFGPNADLTMRASIPALVVFAVRIGDWFVERLLPEEGHKVSEDAVASIAMLAFVIGMATPFQELARPFVVSAEAVDTSESVYGSTNGDATHYLAPRQGWFAERVLAVGVIPTSREIRAPKTNSKYSGTQTAPIP
jgi:hypothetical protein